MTCRVPNKIRVNSHAAIIRGELREAISLINFLRMPFALGEFAKGSRRKATPKYRSRKDPKTVWSGRGVTPVWMREEMKGTKLKKDDFLIARN